MKHLTTIALICLFFIKFAPLVNASEDDIYVLCPRDLVLVSTYRHEDMNVEQRIDAAGKILVPLVGAVEIGGLTLREAEMTIERTLREREMLVNPQVSVRIQEYSVKQVSVLGEVETPGSISFAIETHRMDLREVVARSGGFTSVAKTRDIQIFRKSPSGGEIKIEVDFNALVSSSESFELLYVYDGDVILIPDRIF